MLIHNQCIASINEIETELLQTIWSKKYYLTSHGTTAVASCVWQQTVLSHPHFINIISTCAVTGSTPTWVHLIPQIIQG